MRYFICDRCGERIPKGRQSWSCRGSAVNDQRDWTIRLPEKDFDLCPDCGKTLMEWLGKKPKLGE